MVIQTSIDSLFSTIERFSIVLLEANVVFNNKLFQYIYTGMSNLAKLV